MVNDADRRATIFSLRRRAAGRLLLVGLTAAACMAAGDAAADNSGGPGDGGKWRVLAPGEAGKVSVSVHALHRDGRSVAMGPAGDADRMGWSTTKDRAAGRSPLTAGANAGCRTAAYRLDGTRVSAARGHLPALAWRYNDGNGRDTGLPARTRYRVFKIATYTASRGINKCRRGRIKATSREWSKTRTRPNIGGAGRCLRRDGHSVQGWLRLSSRDILGVTCKWHIGGRVLESDIALNTQSVRWVAGNRCRPRGYDPIGAAVHENLHYLGLDHVNVGDAGIVMRPRLGACDFQWRRLGLGDFRGLQRLYGKR